MSPKQPALARALSDGDDQLVSADEALADLQLRCGGEVPGTIAVPALLEAVRKARRYQLKLARAITAQADDESVTAWVEVEPRQDGEQGCEIVLRNWQTQALPPENLDATQVLRAGINRHLAELTAVLDARQNVLAVDAEASDLQELAGAMTASLGQGWTQFVEIDGNNHRQPMHWRLLDGAMLRVPGSERSWRARPSITRP